jgi:enoyl-CoA hydratase/carnithine racemase
LIDAEEALEMGLVSRVVADDFPAVVDELALELAANGPVALRLLKETLRGTADRSIDDAVAREARAQAETFKTEDAREGIRAMMEKRSPNFEGR